jgi:N,N'-diacetyllegionaminate synthase
MNNQKKVFIIAEAGDNHNGDYDTALKLVDKAVEAGADCVKFQTFVTERVISKLAEKADYQKESTGTGESQYEMVKKLELSFEQFRQIKKYCEQKKIIFLSTPFDLESIDFLQEIDIPFWKIPSGEITNLPYLEKIAHTGKDIIMSTGMCTMEEIQKAIDILKKNGAGKITLLHCNTEYPTPYEDVNLRAMKTMAETFGVEVGYSDHTKGIEVPIAAVAMGAVVIEKHFTLDKNMPGPDHKASLEPDELKQMIQSVRNIEKALGSSEKKPSTSEIKNIDIARKSIVAKKAIKKGEELTEDNLDIKRPGNGISPMYWYDLLGTKAVKDFSEDELITK